MSATIEVVIQLQGRLVENAHTAQTQLDGQGHYVPTLCFEIEAEATGSRCVVRQYFPAGHEQQCKQASYRLKRGALVSFQISTVGLSYRANGASHVHLIEPPQATPAPAAATPAQAEIPA